MNSPIKYDREVSNRCSFNGGNYIEIGKVRSSGLAFVTRYDKNGTPTHYRTFSGYTFNAITTEHDTRRPNNFNPLIDCDDFNIFIAGSVQVNDIPRPVIIGLSNDLTSYSEDIGSDTGELYDISFDDESDTPSVYGCGWCIDSMGNGSSTMCLIIKKPLYGTKGSGIVGDVFPSRTEYFRHPEVQHSAFVKIALDHEGFIACIVSRGTPQLLSATRHPILMVADFIVRYDPGREDLPTQQPFCRMDVTNCN